LQAVRDPDNEVFNEVFLSVIAIWDAGKVSIGQTAFAQPPEIYLPEQRSMICQVRTRSCVCYSGQGDPLLSREDAAIAPKPACQELP
jgi:hypothetical protein